MLPTPSQLSKQIYTRISQSRYFFSHIHPRIIAIDALRAVVGSSLS